MLFALREHYVAYLGLRGILLLYCVLVTAFTILYCGVAVEQGDAAGERRFKAARLFPQTVALLESLFLFRRCALQSAHIIRYIVLGVSHLLDALAKLVDAERLPGQRVDIIAGFEPVLGEGGSPVIVVELAHDGEGLYIFLLSSIGRDI